MSMKKVAIAATLALAATLSACATATPYQPKVTSGAVTGASPNRSWKATAIA